MSKNYKLISDPKTLELIESYPSVPSGKLLLLRELIFRVAEETEGVDFLEETLKWGEPSFLTKHGSTVRIDWKDKNPDQYAMYFKCTSKLIPTFKEVFGDTFKFENDRAIVFKMNEEVPVFALEQCVSAALRYHKVKHLHLLGMV